MPDEFEFREYTSIEDYLKTLEGSKYYHSLLLKAVNHPIRKEILIIINDAKKILKDELIKKLIEKKISIENDILDYNLDYLTKALCINAIIDGNKKQTFYEITQSGQVVKYL